MLNRIETRSSKTSISSPSPNHAIVSLALSCPKIGLSLQSLHKIKIRQTKAYISNICLLCPHLPHPYTITTSLQSTSKTGLHDLLIATGPFCHTLYTPWKLLFRIHARISSFTPLRVEAYYPHNIYLAIHKSIRTPWRQDTPRNIRSWRQGIRILL